MSTLIFQTGSDNFETVWVYLDSNHKAGTWNVNWTANAAGSGVSFAAYVFAPGTYTQVNGFQGASGTSDTLTLTSGKNYYIYGVGNGNNANISTPSLTVDSTPSTTFSQVGHTTSNSISSSAGGGAWMIGGIGVTATSPTIYTGSSYGNTSGTFSYTVSTAGSYVVLAMASGDFALSSTPTITYNATVSGAISASALATYGALASGTISASAIAYTPGQALISATATELFSQTALGSASIAISSTQWETQFGIVPYYMNPSEVLYIPPLPPLQPQYYLYTQMTTVMNLFKPVSGSMGGLATSQLTFDPTWVSLQYMSLSEQFYLPSFAPLQPLYYFDMLYATVIAPLVTGSGSVAATVSELFTQTASGVASIMASGVTLEVEHATGVGAIAASISPAIEAEVALGTASISGLQTGVASIFGTGKITVLQTNSVTQVARGLAQFATAAQGVSGVGTTGSGGMVSSMTQGYSGVNEIGVGNIISSAARQVGLNIGFGSVVSPITSVVSLALTGVVNEVDLIMAAANVYNIPTNVTSGNGVVEASVVGYPSFPSYNPALGIVDTLLSLSYSDTSLQPTGIGNIDTSVLLSVGTTNGIVNVTNLIGASTVDVLPTNNAIINLSEYMSASAAASFVSIVSGVYSTTNYVSAYAEAISSGQPVNLISAVGGMNTNSTIDIAPSAVNVQVFGAIAAVGTTPFIQNSTTYPSGSIVATKIIALSQAAPTTGTVSASVIIVTGMGTGGGGAIAAVAISTASSVVPVTNAIVAAFTPIYNQTGRAFGTVAAFVAITALTPSGAISGVASTIASQYITPVNVSQTSLQSTIVNNITTNVLLSVGTTNATVDVVALVSASPTVNLVVTNAVVPSMSLLLSQSPIGIASIATTKVIIFGQSLLPAGSIGSSLSLLPSAFGFSNIVATESNLFSQALKGNGGVTALSSIPFITGSVAGNSNISALGLMQQGVVTPEFANGLVVAAPSLILSQALSKAASISASMTSTALGANVFGSSNIGGSGVASINLMGIGGIGASVSVTTVTFSIKVPLGGPTIPLRRGTKI